MQKNALSYVLAVASLSLLVSCGAGKKEEVKVAEQPVATEQTQAPVEQPAAEANKEVALADQAAQTEVAVDANKAAEENKVA